MPLALPSAAVIGSLPGSPGGDSLKATSMLAGTLAAPYQAPKVLRSIAPEYPEEARWEKRTGLATLGFRVEADGSVVDVRMLHSSGHADLDAAAVESLRHWRFVLPTGGAPASWYRYLFRFELT
ncbi:MAG: energy transducer TonB [Thiobacillus sp.]|nr:energy transducer TonB [Thiobacillus sp.]MDP3126768.1 energy transducer TonB [Thiobacillus sp.]